VDNSTDSVDKVWNTLEHSGRSTLCDCSVTYPAGMTGQDTAQPRKLLRPQEVQKLLGVGRTTLHDYESSGRLTAERTLGGHRRYPADQPALRDALRGSEAGQ